MLKPQDIVVLLKVYSWQPPDWKYSDLATSLGMSASEVHAALKRCDISGLYERGEKRVLKTPLLEFLIYGVKYVFPSPPGAISRGIPTAHSAEPLKSQLMDSSDVPYVWAYPTGEVRGQVIKPLYRSVPDAVQNDPNLYELLTLIDGIRVGRVREQRLAATELSQRLKTP